MYRLLVSHQFRDWLKRPGNPGWHFRVLNCASENGLSSQTRGRLRDPEVSEKLLYSDPSIGGTEPGIEFDHHLSHPALVKLWVAAIDSELVGLCGLLVEHGESELEPIVVSPSHRTQGINGSLAQQAIAESRRLGMKFINVRPVARNVRAIGFFHREGSRSLGHVDLCIRLDEGVFSDPARVATLHGVDFTF